MNQTKGFTKNLIFEQGKKFSVYGIALIYAYLIANLLGPKDYGLIIYFMNYAMALVNFAGVSFIEGAISVFTPKYKSKKLFLKFLKVQYVIIIPTVIFIFLFAENIVGFLGKENPMALQIAATLILIMPLYTSLIYLVRSFKRFDKSAFSETVVQAANLAFAFTLIIFLQQGIFGVVYAQFLAVLLGLCFLIYFAKNLKFEEKPLPPNELKKYVKSAYPKSFITKGYKLLLLTLMGLFVDPIMLGYYYIVRKMNDALIGVSSNVIKDVFGPYIMEKHDDKKVLANFVSLNIKASFIFSIIIGIFLVLTGGFLLQIFFPEYINAYILIPFLVLIAIFGSLWSIDHVFTALNEIKYSLIANIVGALAAITTILILSPEYGIFGIIAGMCARLITGGVLLYYFSKKLGVDIEIIPRKKDLEFFFSKTIQLLNAFAKR